MFSAHSGLERVNVSASLEAHKELSQQGRGTDSLGKNMWNKQLGRAQETSKKLQRLYRELCMCNWNVTFPPSAVTKMEQEKV